MNLEDYLEKGASGKHPSARQVPIAMTIQTKLRMVIAPIVITSNAPPRRM